MSEIVEPSPRQTGAFRHDVQHPNRYDLMDGLQASWSRTRCSRRRQERGREYLANESGRAAPQRARTGWIAIEKGGA